MHDAIVVGSGAAGAFAAYGLRGAKTLVLDAGVPLPEAPTLDANLYDLRKSRDLFRETVGEGFESLHSIEGGELSPKVKAPLLRPVIERPSGEPEPVSDSFSALMSYTTGGLANAWGAQVYRFDDADLRGFPLRAADLEPFYDEVTEVVGVSGAEDDLARFHGSARGLQPPLDLSAAGRGLLDRYSRRADEFRREGLFIGRPRLAVLSRDHAGRKACAYENLEFFKPRQGAVYSPAYTIEEMTKRGEIEYAPGHLVKSYRETEDGVEVLSKGQTLRARKLILCLGALNTARLVLLANGDTESRLPLVENPCSFAPLVSLKRIGMPLEKRSFYAQLNLFYSGALWPEPLVGMIYAVDGLLRSDLLFNFPLSVRGCLAASRTVLPAMALFQLFYPGDPRPENSLSIDAKGNLILRYAAQPPGGAEAKLLGLLRRTGWRSDTRFVRPSKPGGSVHYAGPLPMRERPGARYETDRDGLLAGTKRIYVGDAASFPRLPAKNLTFTIMANALRIGRHVKAQMRQSD